MYLKVICVILFGFVVGGISGGARDKLHIKVYVPEVVNRHHHHNLIYHHHRPKEQVKKKPNKGYHYDQSGPYIHEPLNDGYKQSWKTMRTEKYETETIDNPHSDNPANRYIVKEKLKVVEKLPFIDTPIGYDHEYEYPLSENEHSFHQNEKIVDFNNAKTDPFVIKNNYKIPVVNFESPKVKEEQKVKKPKNYNYHYKYPSNDYEYHKNVHLVDYYINKNTPSEALHTKPHTSDDYVYNDVPKSGQYEGHDFGHFGPSDEPQLEKYRSPDFVDNFHSSEEPTSEKYKNSEFVDNFSSSENDGDSEKYRSSNFDNLGPSDDEIYNSYKTDGPSYLY